jgi:hypothetical protein
MAAVLQALGVSTSTPSPDAYNNQIAEDKNLKAARSNCETLKASLCLAVNVGRLSGLDTGTLQARCDDISALCKSNLTSAEIEQKTKEYALAAKDTRASTLADQKVQITDVFNTISARMITVTGNTNISPELITKYTDLNEKITTALNDIKAADPLDDTTPLPVIPSEEEFRISIDDLDNQYEEELTKKGNLGRRLWNKLRSLMPYITIIMCIIGAILGGIISANTHANEPFWAIKIYYFFYGAILFPISLGFGAYSPPEWKSGFIPLISTTPRAPVEDPLRALPAQPPAVVGSPSSTPPGTRPMGPKPMGPTPMGPKPMGPKPMGPKPMGPKPMGPKPQGTRPPVSSPPVSSPPVSTPQGSKGLETLNKVGDFVKGLPPGTIDKFAGLVGKIQVPSFPKIEFPTFGGGGEPTPPQPLGKAGAFTYADGVQYMSKNMLRALSIAEIIVLGSIGVFYGVDKFAIRLK